MVLKDGQIIEQGSHKELLAQDGVFATMWADQISASGDAPGSISGQSIKKEAIVGYLQDQTDAASVAEVDAAEGEGLSAPQERAADTFVATPEAIPAALEPTEAEEAPPVPTKEPIAFPSEEPAPESTPAPPLAFPTSDSASQRALSERIPSQTVGGITFGDTVNSPPSRTGTPEPGADQKRKRISSQNLQRFARKMSLGTRRSGSTTSVPRESSSTAQTSQDGAGTSTPLTSNDSPAASVKDKKKDKKEKRKTIF